DAGPGCLVRRFLFVIVSQRVRADARPDDKLREAIQESQRQTGLLRRLRLLAMTGIGALRRLVAPQTRRVWYRTTIARVARRLRGGVESRLGSTAWGRLNADAD